MVISVFSSQVNDPTAYTNHLTPPHNELWPDGCRLRLRLGLHTGEVQLRDDANYIGAAVNRCARLPNLGSGGQTLLSTTTCDLVADHVPDKVSVRDLGALAVRSGCTSSTARIYRTRGASNSARV